MKLGWGVGTAIAILLALALYFFGFYGPLGNLSTLEALLAAVFLFAGVWTIVAALVVVERKDKMFYGVWGLVVASLALFDFVPPAEAIGIFLVAIILLLVFSVFTKRTKDVVSATTVSPAPSGGTPAAS